MKVEIWSDIACPWCYIGKRRFEAALAALPFQDEVELQWRSFELDPAAPSTGGTPGPDYADRLAGKYGTSRAGAQQMLDTMTDAAAAEGLDFHFERAQPANTYHAHQVLHLAHDRGVQDAVKERLLRAYFCEGAALGDREVLARLAGEAGLDPAEVAAVLANQTYADAVRADEAQAAAFGISGVPFFVLDRAYAVSGAQPVDVLRQAMQQAHAASRPLTVVGAAAGDTSSPGTGSGGGGAVCGPDGCAV